MVVRWFFRTIREDVGYEETDQKLRTESSRGSIEESNDSDEPERLTSAQHYKQLVLNALTMLEMNNMEEIENMTLVEYNWRMEAYKLKLLDKRHDMHLTAFLNNAVTETVKKGEEIVPRYPTFKDFFDYDKYKKQIFGEDVDDDKEKDDEPKLTERDKLMILANS